MRGRSSSHELMAGVGVPRHYHNIPFTLNDCLSPLSLSLSPSWFVPPTITDVATIPTFTLFVNPSSVLPTSGKPWWPATSTFACIRSRTNIDVNDIDIIPYNCRQNCSRFHLWTFATSLIIALRILRTWTNVPITQQLRLSIGVQKRKIHSRKYGRIYFSFWNRR